MNKPFFSIIIPVYNSLKLFDEALTSVLRQTFSSYEVIVTDDSSNDDICDYVNSISDTRIRYKHNKLSLGAVRNWNLGLAMAIGEFVIIMHHDERFSHSDFLLKIKSLVVEDYDVVISNVKVNINGRNHRKKMVQAIEPYFLYHPELIFADNVIGPCACLTVRRSLLEKFDENLKWYVDVEWYYRILSKGNKIKYLTEEGIDSVHGHKGQITSNLNISACMLHDRKVILKKYKHNISIMLMLQLNRMLFSRGLKAILSRIIR